MKDSEFRKFLKSIDEARDIHAGKRRPSREIHIRPVEIKAIRRKLHVSQMRFAQIMGISPGTLRNWEQGRTYPEGAARVLLKVAEIRPDVIQKALAA